MIRVLICDDQDVVCEGLRVILGGAEEIEVVGVAHDGAAALALIPRTQPDVVLMDLKMPVLNGVQATRQIRAAHPATRVLVLTTYDADEWVFDAIRGGASGYLLKDTPREELIAAIRATAAGATAVAPAIAGKLFAHIAQAGVAAAGDREQLAAPTRPAGRPRVHELSERELEVLRLLAHGLSNNEIARRLYLSEGTVRNYVSAIFAKLDVTDRTQAALAALRLGLADLHQPVPGTLPAE
jgi:DNA-binding NarL/FixJ family response regulator